MILALAGQAKSSNNATVKSVRQPNMADVQSTPAFLPLMPKGLDVHH